ncbi:MAG: YciI family protein [Pseudomonadota bacterium]
MKYLLLLHDNEDAWLTMEEAKKNEIFGSYMAYTEALKKANAYHGGAPLEHSKTSKRVRASGVQDGPFVDGKEQLGGFYMIEADNLDEALDWAARCPCASIGHVEVRPVWHIGD